MAKKNITKLKHRFPLRQIRQIPKLFRLYWPVIFLVLLTLAICYLNYEPGTFLIGWDNLNPEFDIWMNLKRALYGVWQEHRSLGLLAGQAHAADLPRIFLIILFQWARVPLSFIRYLTTFIPLVLGPLGVYFLFYHYLFREKLDAKTTQFASFLGALFYLLNLNTVQTFFVPFETFTWFYGAFPWLLFFLVSYLKKPSPWKLFFFSIVSFLSAPSFYVETIFIVFILIVVPFIIEYLTDHHERLSAIKTSFNALAALIVPQLFWLLPIIFFVFTGSSVAQQAKINQISSPETYFRNLQFGTLKDVALLKSYLFNYVDMGGAFKYDYLLNVWRSHLNIPFISLLGYLFFAIILTGLYYSLKKKFSWTPSFIALLFLSLFFLLGGGLLINQAIPIIGELFRSPFTKFSIPLSLAYSFFFAIGSIFILDIFTFLDSRLTYLLTLFTVTVSLIIFASPVFSGSLIYSNMRLSMPQEYFDLFNYLKNQKQTERIASFPQYTFWGWNYYDWGYRGSGFLWHGIKQPLLDRAFDVWDIDSEKYYQEISTALYSGNQKEFENLLDKYSVNFVLIDNHVISSDGKTDLGINQLNKFIEDSGKFTLDKNFSDGLVLYRVNPNNNFLSVSGQPNEEKPFDDISYRPDTNWNEKGGYLSIGANITATQSGLSLHLPSLTDTENLLPVRVEYQKSGNILNLKLTTVTPVVFAGDRQINISADPLELSIPIPADNSFILELDDQYFLIQFPDEIPEISDFIHLTDLYIPAKNNFPVSLYSVSGAHLDSLTSSLENANPVQCYTEKPDRKIEKIVSPSGISLIGTDVNGCLFVPLPSISRENLISYTFTYSSPSLLTGNVNISGQDFISQTPVQPLEPSQTPKKTTLFAHSTGKYQQLNLVLEAAESTSVQEVTYQDISVSIHPLIYSSRLSLFNIPAKDITLDSPVTRIQISLPLTATTYDILQTPSANSLLPESRNCDQFNKGKTAKTISDEGFFYQSQNATECDSLNLRHLSHAVNYLFSFNAKFQKGLTLTTCLENYATRRCDIYDRLADTGLTQSLIQTISNPEETPGYTLHIFNESIGNRVSSNLLKSFSVRPIPLRFIQSVSLINHDTTDVGSSIVSSDHLAEYLYTAKVNSSGKDLLNLYQSSSPSWISAKVPSDTFAVPSWLLPVKILSNYLLIPKLNHENLGWFNSWDLPSGTYNLIIFYLPQFLEFLGFLAAIIFVLILFIRLFQKPHS